MMGKKIQKEEIETVQDSKVQSTKLKFTFSDQEGKIRIEATNQNSSLHYVGYINTNPNIDFDFIKESVNEYQFLINNEELVKLKIGGIVMELHSKSKLQNMKLKETIKELKNEVHELKQVLRQFGLSRNPQPKISGNLFTWQKFEQKGYQIKGNILTKTQANDQRLIFCLKTTFSRDITRRHHWAWKFHKITGIIMLGICMRGRVYQKKITLSKTGHGYYAIHSNGLSYSDSSQEFNQVNRSFKIGDGDVIDMEYNPVSWTLKFMKKKNELFEMPINPPPQNISYKPCVMISHKDSSVEVISRSQS